MTARHHTPRTNLHADGALMHLVSLYPHPTTGPWREHWHGSAVTGMATADMNPSGTLRALERKGLIVSQPDPEGMDYGRQRQFATTAGKHRLVYSLTRAGHALGTQLRAERAAQAAELNQQHASAPYAIPAPRTAYGQGTYTGEHLTTTPARAGAMAAFALPSRGFRT